MCGITGVLYARPEKDQRTLLTTVKAMGDTLRHRGPDDSGEWADEQAGIALAHRRLSIIDLSPTGHQPMTSGNQRYVIVFNGEIYNYRDIRAYLEKHGCVFAGHSDTETLLESIAFQGLDKTLEMINGMFAFALWDRENKQLTLARDRLGKKPLYYGWCNGAFLFGSELKALRIHPEFIDEIDRTALAQFIQFSWLNGPASIYRNIKKLQPGTYITLDLSKNSKDITPVVYWSALDKASQGVNASFQGSYEEAIDQLQQILLQSVNRRMIADVELGALLSGGIDSSLVVALMQAQSVNHVKTFSIGFHEATHNEAEHAKKIADHLGTEHSELYVTPADCMDVIPELPSMYDEPFGDVSQIPTYLVSKLAREKVKVVLSGDGGDELFAGYTRYFRCIEHWKKHEKLPVFLRPAAGYSMDKLARLLWFLLGSTRTNADARDWRRLGSKLDKRARRIASRNSQELFVNMMKRYKAIEELVPAAGKPNTILSNSSDWPDFADPVFNMMLIDTLCYLPDDILVKVDRASMANSLEARAPLLDKELAEFSWSLPFEMKVDEAGGKRILKAVLARYLPTELTDRKKMGFGVPIGQWLRGPLSDWAETLLDPSSLRQQGYFDEQSVQRLWKQHQSGWRNHSDILWSILMFQAWNQ